MGDGKGLRGYEEERTEDDQGRGENRGQCLRASRDNRFLIPMAWHPEVT